MPAAVNVLFVCQHGAAKSVIAARHLAELAHARGLTLNASAAGLEPDEVIPPHVIAGLRGDGVDDHEAPPQAVTRELLENAQIVVAFGCDLSALGEASGRIVQWSGVPAVSDGYEAARTEIVGRLHAILDEAEERSSEEPRG
jgi:arsenate reductase (thioredoxin)